MPALDNLHKEKEPKERAADHLVRRSGLSCAARKVRATSESRFVPPSRLLVFCWAAQLREKALLQLICF